MMDSVAKTSVQRQGGWCGRLQGQGRCVGGSGGEGGGVVSVETFDLELASGAMRGSFEEGYGQVGAVLGVASWLWRWGCAGQVDAPESLREGELGWGEG